jgi:hypothetical protein
LPLFAVIVFSAQASRSFDPAGEKRCELLYCQTAKAPNQAVSSVALQILDPFPIDSQHKSKMPSPSSFNARNCIFDNRGFTRLGEWAKFGEALEENIGRRLAPQIEALTYNAVHHSVE